MTDLPWLRLYTDTVDNEKIRLLAFEDRWHYIALLCLKQQGILDTESQLLERKISVKLGLQLRELDEVKRRLIEVELIGEDWNPLGWDNKQFKSDSSRDRVRKFRESKGKKKRNGDVTLPKRNSNAIESDKESESYIDKNKKNSRFTPPSLQDVIQYCQTRNNSVNPQEFIDHYETNGWFRGKTKIKDWKACVRTWENKKGKSNGKQSRAKQFSDKLDEIAERDIAENGFTETLG